MTKYKALIQKLTETDCMSSKEGGRRLTRIEDCVDALMQWLKDYIKKSKEL